MNLTTREDIDAPAEEVYRAITDFDRFERLLMRRGIDVLRRDGIAPPDPGARWLARFDWRGKPYEIDAELVSVEPGDGYAVEAHGAGLICLGVVDVVPLSRARTRLMVSLELRATSLGSRLLLQSLRLASGSLSARLRNRVADFARGLPGNA